MKKLLVTLCAVMSAGAFAGDLGLQDSQAAVAAAPAPQAAPQVANSAVMPQGSRDYGNTDLGMYAGVEVGAANSGDINAGADAAGAGRIALGYKFSQYMGVEMGMTGTSYQIGGNVQAPLQFYDVSFKGFLPITIYFDLHAQVGAAYAYMAAPTVNGTLSGAGTDATVKGMVGAGFDVYLNRSFAITVDDYNYLGANAGATSGAGGNTNIVMGGIKYNF